MKELIDECTWHAIAHHDDGVAGEYYRRLREEKKFYTTACLACQTKSYPPRPVCPNCFSDRFEWVQAPDEATLYAFTMQLRALRFMAPDVIGIVEIAGIGRIVSKINAPIGKLHIGQKLRFEPFELSRDLTVHSFTPVAE